jgi:CHAT domain-containing protein
MMPLSSFPRLAVAALALALGCAAPASGRFAQSRANARLAADAAAARKAEAAARKPDAVPPRKLAAGETAARELEGGGAHLYTLAMRAGECLHVTVEQRGIDVTLTLTNASGKKVAEHDGMNDEYGPELLSFTTQEPGDYVLKIASLKPDAAAGRYDLSVDALREPTDEDRARARAERVFDEAERLLAEKTVESCAAAYEKYKEAITLWRQLGYRHGVANCLYCLAYIHSHYGEMRESIDFYEQSLEISRALEDRPTVAITLFSIGLDYAHLGDTRKTFEYLLPALEMRLELGNRRGAANVLNAVGAVYASTGESRRALESFQRALELYRAVSDRGGEILTLDNIGCVHASTGDSRKALDYFGQALEALRATERRAAELGTLELIDDKYFSLNDLQKVLDDNSRAFVLTHASGAKAGFAYTLYNAGKAHEALGEFAEALDAYAQALAVWRAAGDLDGEAYTLYRMGRVLGARGERREALARLGLALKIHRQVGDRDGQAQTLAEVGRLELALGQKEQALAHLEEAVGLRQKLGYRRGEAGALAELGGAYYVLNDGAKAYEALTRALGLSREAGDRAGQANTLHALARVERDRGDAGGAVESQAAALKIIESLRSDILGSDSRASYLATVRDQYDFYIDLLMRGGGEESLAAAFDASERARARSLLDSLAEARVDIRRGVDPALAEREHTLRRALEEKSEYQVRLLGGRHTKEQLEDVSREVVALTSQLGDVETQIKANSPAYAALTHPQTLSLKDVQRQLLDPDTMLLEYALGAERSYLWAVTDGAVEGYELPAREKLEGEAREVYRLLTERNRTVAGETAKQKEARVARAEADYARASAALARDLLEPASALLAKKKRVLVVADGALQYVPFAALPSSSSNSLPSSSSDALVFSHEVVSLPSASVLAVLRKEEAERKEPEGLVAVVADPVFSPDDPRLKPDAAARRGQRDATTQTRGLTSAAKREPAPTATRELAQALRDLSASGDGTGLPRLLYTRREAEGIMSAVPAGRGMQALDFDASRALVNSQALARYRVVHFATHGLLDGERPELSGIVLSLFDAKGRPQNGFLRLHEIYNLSLPADLVVLSACQTALGKEVKGEGLVGLTRGFMYAGAGRVSASLWKVDDAGTAELMRRFYAHMLKDGQTPAAALRAAQIEMAGQSLWRSPYFWAAFVMQGDWK